MSQNWDMSGNNLIVDSITTSGTSSDALVNTVSATTAGASVDGSIFTTNTEVALGTYANGANAKLNFGTAGSVTGLGGAFCSELDLGPGTASGSYTVFEGELIMPTSSSTGTRTSFFSLNLSGAGASAFDTSGFLFDLNGLTAGSGKVFEASSKTGIAKTHTLRVQIGGTTYYIPLHTSSTFGGS